MDLHILLMTFLMISGTLVIHYAPPKLTGAMIVLATIAIPIAMFGGSELISFAQKPALQVVTKPSHECLRDIDRALVTLKKQHALDYDVGRLDARALTLFGEHQLSYSRDAIRYDLGFQLLANDNVCRVALDEVCATRPGEKECNRAAFGTIALDTCVCTPLEVRSR